MINMTNKTISEIFLPKTGLLFFNKDGTLTDYQTKFSSAGCPLWSLMHPTIPNYYIVGTLKRVKNKRGEWVDAFTLDIKGPHVLFATHILKGEIPTPFRLTEQIWENVYYDNYKAAIFQVSKIKPRYRTIWGSFSINN